MNEPPLSTSTNDQKNSKTSDEDVMVFKRSHVYAVLVPLAFILGVSVGYLFWGRRVTSPPQPQAAQQQEAQEGSVTRYDVSVDDDPSIGPSDAAITIIEFSDYECPYCRRWYDQVFVKIREEYSDQVRIVYRDFPLSSIHPSATPAAEAANCAGEQGKYWEFHDKLFSGSELGEEIYQQYASELGLDTKKFQACIDSGKYSSEVQNDYQYASTLGVRSTPTFFLNGIPLVGAQPYEVFKDVIEKELAGEIP